MRAWTIRDWLEAERQASAKVKATMARADHIGHGPEFDGRMADCPECARMIRQNMDVLLDELSQLSQDTEGGYR